MNRLIILLALSFYIPTSNAQDKLYPNTFPIENVKLLDGPFAHACQLNTEVLLQYDTDRLLAPYLKEAGLSPKGESFPNWIGLDGHVGGHYLSALAVHYAATGNKECKQRMDYMIAELKKCQEANGDGYLGGVPEGKAVFEEIKKGNVEVVWKSWVPWYNIHKIYAGLKDAWLYGNSQEAKQMFLDLCDWGLDVIAPLNEQQMESMLNNEFGGMNEVYADAYQITKDSKYLEAAKRFSHHLLLDSMAQGVDNLDNMHANTQVPKVVGYQRVAELDNSENELRAAEFFWNQVVNHRSLSFGGNSRREHFPEADDCYSYVEEREGPESCNTYNMLKLTEGLFRMNPQANYADYYERALFNHILSTQHPEHGGYVYFTPARPSHYRVYSAPNCAMWCCVGTGMENHGKYGEFIYTHSSDSLLVNLFIPSQVDWKNKDVKLTQTTNFPNEETSQLVVNVEKPQQFKLLIRYPEWVNKGEMIINCDGVNYASEANPCSYVTIDRIWNDGDVVDLTMPMHTYIEEMPNVPNYITIMHGPILLGAKMGTDRMDGLIADDSRMGHIAHGPLVPLFDAPKIIGSKEDVLKKINALKPIANSPLSFDASALFEDNSYSNIVLEPFYRIHDSRYSIYWFTMPETEYSIYKQKLEEEEKQKIDIDKRTIDAVGTGEQQPEVDHNMKQEGSQSGYHRMEAWRKAVNNGFFEYKLATNKQTNLSLLIKYWGDERNNTDFDILIDGQLLVNETNTTINNNGYSKKFITKEYIIPASILKDKSYVNVRFVSKNNHPSNAIYYVRLISQ